MQRTTRGSLVILCGALSLPCLAQSDSPDLAKTSQNPVGDLISLPLQNNTNFDFGPFDRTQNILNVQPVIPTHISQNWNLINRIITPIVYQPVGEDDSEFGLGDTLYQGFFSPVKPGKIIWGIGPVALVPTATDDALGTDQWGLGPGVVVLSMPGSWVVGAVASNVWSVAGDDDRPDVNQMTFQYFVNYNFDDGWYVTSGPIITANWEADSGDRWTVPFGGGAGKVFKIGKQASNVSAQVFYNAARPDDGARWTLRFQWQLLFPQ